MFFSVWLPGKHAHNKYTSLFKIFKEGSLSSFRKLSIYCFRFNFRTHKNDQLYE